MLIKEKKVEEVEINPYEWPESYYMEGDPKKRRQLLDERLSLDDSPEVNKQKELFEHRYQQTRDGRYIDNYLKAWMELFVMGNNQAAAMKRRKNIRTAQTAAKMMCLDGVETYGRQMIYDELCNMAGVYISSCLKDPQYQSVLLGMGRMKEDRVKQKIHSDLELVTKTVPELLEMEDVFALLREAVVETESQLL